MKKYGSCPICGSAIAIPGEDGYLCSSRVCGAEIIIKDKKKQKILSRHSANGWVKTHDIKKLVIEAQKKKQKENKSGDSQASS